MEEEDPKNKLCSMYPRHQKPKFYEKKDPRSPDHLPIFRATVVLYDGTKYKGRPAGNKTEAHMNASREALKHALPKANNNNMSKIQPKQPKPKMLMIVDMETMPNFLVDIYDEFWSMSEFDIIACISHTSTHFKNLPTRVMKEVCPHVDTFIPLMMGGFLSQNSYKQYIVVTLDKFGDKLVDLVKMDGMSWSSNDVNIVVVTHYNQLDHFLPGYKRDIALQKMLYMSAETQHHKILRDIFTNSGIDAKTLELAAYFLRYPLKLNFDVECYDRITVIGIFDAMKKQLLVDWAPDTHHANYAKLVGNKIIQTMFDYDMDKLNVVPSFGHIVLLDPRIIK
jgi:hypothetical protein